jgi:hypothetical protein
VALHELDPRTHADPSHQEQRLPLDATPVGER